MNSSLLDINLRRKVRQIMLLTGVVQCIYLVYPLSMYMIYLKVLMFNNKATMLTVISVLAVACAFQYTLKYFKSLQYNELKACLINKVKLANIINCIYKDDNKNFEYVHTVYRADNIVKNYLDGQISRVNYIILAIYFIAILLIINILAFVPFLIFGVGYYISQLLKTKQQKLKDKYSNISVHENALFKEHLSKVHIFQGMKISKTVYEIYKHIVENMHLYKASYQVIESLIGRIIKVCSISNIVCIAGIGIPLAKADILISQQDIITSILLTVWVTRAYSDVLLNMQISQIDKGKENNIERQNKNTDNRYDFFYGTILDNITLFDERKNNKAHKAIKTLNLDKYISKLPYLYNYVIIDDNDEALPMDFKKGLITAREIVAREDDLSSKPNESVCNVIDSQLENKKIIRGAD